MTRIFLAILAFTLLSVSAVAQEPLRPVKLITVQSQNEGNTRQFFGQVVASQTVELAFQVGGQIVRFPVLEGELIPKGGLIAQLDLTSFELAREQANLENEQADRVVSRYQRLQGSAVSEVALEDAITNASLASVSVRKAAEDLEHATLHAPYDALVAERIVDNFTTIAAGTSVVRLHDMSELRVEIDVPEVLFQQAGTDPDVTVTAKFPASKTIYPLELREFNAETSSIGQTFKLTFGMEPPEGLRILPGSSVTVTAVLDDDQSDLVIPATALTPGDDGRLTALVFEPAEDDTGVLRRVIVDVEPLASGGMRVLGGLEEGTEIVAMVAQSLEDGLRVRRFLGFGQ